jgi:hypothetical protein
MFSGVNVLPLYWLAIAEDTQQQRNGCSDVIT